MIPNAYLRGPALLVVAELPDGSNRDLVDIRRQIIGFNLDSVATADSQPAGPFTRGEIRVSNQKSPVIRYRRFEMKCVTRMLLDEEFVTTEREHRRLFVDRNKNPFGIQRTGHLGIAGQPFRAVGSRQRPDQRTQILRERQLRQADLIIDQDSTGRERNLDRPIDPLIGDVVRPRIRRGQTDADESEKESHGMPPAGLAHSMGMAGWMPSST